MKSGQYVTKKSHKNKERKMRIVLALVLLAGILLLTVGTRGLFMNKRSSRFGEDLVRNDTDLANHVNDPKMLIRIIREQRELLDRYETLLASYEAAIRDALADPVDVLSTERSEKFGLLLQRQIEDK